MLISAAGEKFLKFIPFSSKFRKIFAKELGWWQRPKNIGISIAK